VNQRGFTIRSGHSKIHCFIRMYAQRPTRTQAVHILYRNHRNSHYGHQFLAQRWLTPDTCRATRCGPARRFNRDTDIRNRTDPPLSRLHGITISTPRQPGQILFLHHPVCRVLHRPTTPF
jgi:hypothetical protein